MLEDLSDYRKSYERQALLESHCPDHPITLFREWFVAADRFEVVEEANAMTVSTIGRDGFPKSRVVLLKKYSEEGFVFYTNYASEKGRAILENCRVCFSFFLARTGAAGYY